MLQAPAGQGAFSSSRATWVALSAVTILVLALINSIWHSDVSGTIALLGLLSIYMSSTELLFLFTVLAPASIIIDAIRLSGYHPPLRGRGWLVLFSLAMMLAKAAGAFFAWSLHRAIASGDGYQPINTAQPRGGPLHQGGAPDSSYPPHAAGGPSPGGVMGPEDPFAAYAPPRADAVGGSHMTSSYQPFPTSTQQHV